MKRCNLSRHGLAHLVIPEKFEINIDEDNHVCELSITEAELAEAGSPHLFNGRVRIHSWDGLSVEEIDSLGWNLGVGTRMTEARIPAGMEVSSSEGIELHADEVSLHVDCRCGENGSSEVKSFRYRFHSAGWEAEFDVPEDIAEHCTEFESKLGQLVRKSREGH